VVDLPHPSVERAADRNVVRGVLTMLAATLLFSAMHGSIRHVANLGVHPFEIAFFRNLFSLLFVLPWLIRFGLEPLRTSRFKMHALRTVFNVVAMLCFFYAIAITPLAQVTALNFTAPIFATVLAIIVLGETVRLRRWSAIVIGFAGTFVILRPGFEAVTLGQALALASSLSWAFALVIIKMMSRTESSITIIAYMALLMIPLSFVPAVFVWSWPSIEQLLWMLAIGLLGGGAQYLMTESLRLADTSVVMPIDFFKLIWVAALAYVAFGEVPDVWTWIGGAVIFASTFYIAYRERQVALARAAASQPAPGAADG